MPTLTKNELEKILSDIEKPEISSVVQDKISLSPIELESIIQEIEKPAEKEEKLISEKTPKKMSLYGQVPFELEEAERPPSLFGYDIAAREAERKAETAVTIGGLSGFVPGGKGLFPKEKYIPKEDKALGLGYDIAGFGGSLMKYYGYGQLLAPLAPIVAKTEFAQQIADKSLALRNIVSQLSPKVAAMIPFISERATGYAASRGATWFTAKLLDNVGEFILGTKEITPKTVSEPLTSGLFGSLLGISHVFVDDMPASNLNQYLNPKMFAIAGILGGARKAIPKLYDQVINENAISKEDILDISLNAIFTGLVEAMGHDSLVRTWKNADLQDFYHNKTIAKIMQVNNVSREQAEVIAKDMGDVVNSFYDATKIVATIKDQAPASFWQLPGDKQSELGNEVIRKIKDGVSFQDAWQSIADKVTNFLSEGRPEISAILPEPIKKQSDYRLQLIKTGKTFESNLKKAGFGQDVINQIKNQKSFSSLKENAMTDKEAKAAIKEMKQLWSLYNDTKAIKETASTQEIGESYFKAKKVIEKSPDEITLKEVQDLTPEDLKGEIGFEAKFPAIIRGTRHVLRGDPYVYFNGFKPINDASIQRRLYTDQILIEPVNLAKKELKLTKLERENVTKYRMLKYFHSIGKELTVELPKLNEKEKKWNNYLTILYEKLAKEFNVKQVYPYDMYLPLLDEKHLKEDEAFFKKYFESTVPKEIDAFFKKKRENSTTKDFTLDSLELTKKYVYAGSKEKFLGPAIDHYNKTIRNNPNITASMKHYLKSYIYKMLNYPTILNNTFFESVKTVSNGLIDDERALSYTNFLIDLTYVSKIGLKGSLAVRNLLQSINTACDIGYLNLLTGLKDFIFEGGWKEAKDIGALPEYVPEIYDRDSPLSKLRDVMLVNISITDRVNRGIAVKSAKHVFDKAWGKYKNVDKFITESRIKYVDKVVRAEIKQKLSNGEYEEARNIYCREISAKTQYLYTKEDSPLITVYQPGRFYYQFASWPENYLELLIDWKRNKNYGAMVRQGVTAIILAYLASKTGMKIFEKAIAPMSLPFTRYKIRRYSIPPSLEIFEDLFHVFLDPSIEYAKSRDPEKTIEEFKKAGKRLGKSAMYLIPGAVAAKEALELEKKYNFIGLKTRITR